jgi:hypothetical protein
MTTEKDEDFTPFDRHSFRACAALIYSWKYGVEDAVRLADQLTTCFFDAPKPAALCGPGDGP